MGSRLPGQRPACVRGFLRGGGGVTGKGPPFGASLRSLAEARSSRVRGRPFCFSLWAQPVARRRGHRPRSASQVSVRSGRIILLANEPVAGQCRASRENHEFMPEDSRPDVRDDLGTRSPQRSQTRVAA